MSENHIGSGIEPVMVTMAFDTESAADLTSILAKYVVLSRTHEGCRNIDLVSSVTVPGRLVVVQKWASTEAQRAHFDSQDMVDMAAACEPLLSRPPEIDLLEGISMHDLA